MDIRKLQRAIVDGLEDVKAQNIVVFNTEALSPLFERVIVASGTSNRQTKALASSVRETVKERGYPLPRIEGEDNGEWIVVDCGAAVAHIMQPAMRDYYRLEEIWGGKAVKMKMGGDGAAAQPAKAAGKTAAKLSAAPAKAPARAATSAPSKVPTKSASRTAPKPAKTAAGAKTKGAKTAAKKAAPRRRTPAR